MVPKLALMPLANEAAMASAWAVMHHLGEDGYLRLTREAREATLQIASFISSNDRLCLRAKPQTTLICFGAKDPAALNVFAVADELARHGWYVDRQTPPDSLHCTVNAIHHDKISQFTHDLQLAINEVLATNKTGDKGSYGTIS